MSVLSQLKSATRLPSATEPIEFYSTQLTHDLQKIFIEAIDQAHHSVTFMIYALKDPSIIEALNRRAEKGIQVRLICDAQASPKIRLQLHSKIILTQRLSKGLMHNKILVVDTSLILAGSANMTGESLKVHSNLVIAVFSPELAQYIESKASGLHEYLRETAPSPKIFTINNQQLTFHFLPDSSDAASKISGMLRAAKSSIRVAMFTWTRDDFAQELILAKRRGCQVEVLLDRHSAAGASHKITTLFQRAAIPLRVNSSQGLLHHKFVWLDNDTLLLGSANWTSGAFTKNDDFFLVLSPLTPKQQSLIGKLWKRLNQESQLLQTPVVKNPVF